MEQKVTVKRGSAVDVPLRIYGTRSQTLGWAIKRAPAHGKLSNLRATGAESAAVTYTPPMDVRIASDRFSFSVRSSEGVSAPADVLITILDDDPRIVAPVEIEFGSLLTGRTAAKTLDFANEGGGIAEGEIVVDPPWMLDGAKGYWLGHGERHVARIIFAPDQSGDFTSDVRFTSQPDRVVTLHGVAGDPLAVSPATVRLVRDAGSTLRLGAFTLRNNTDAPMDVAVKASARLAVPALVKIGAGEGVSISLRAADGDVAALDELIGFAAGPHAAQLAVKADALPAMVEARPARVTFRVQALGAVRKETVTLHNRGGAPARVALAVDEPFAIEQPPFNLAPGASEAVALSFFPKQPGKSQAALKVTVNESAFELPIDADVFAATAPAVQAPPERRARRANPGREAPTADDEPAVPAGALAAKVAVNGNTATIEWPGESPPGAVLRCMVQKLSLGDDEELVETFQYFPSCKFARRDGVNVATVENLESGSSYLFRIDNLNGKDGLAAPVTFAQVRTAAPPPRARRLTFVNALIALALIAGVTALWQRSRNRRIEHRSASSSASS